MNNIFLFLLFFFLPPMLFADKKASTRFKQETDRFHLSHGPSRVFQRYSKLPILLKELSKEEKDPKRKKEIENLQKKTDDMMLEIQSTLSFF